jgi:hypothetical protein
MIVHSPGLAPLPPLALLADIPLPAPRAVEPIVAGVFDGFGMLCLLWGERTAVRGQLLTDNERFVILLLCMLCSLATCESGDAGLSELGRMLSGNVLIVRCCKVFPFL